MTLLHYFYMKRVCAYVGLLSNPLTNMLKMKCWYFVLFVLLSIWGLLAFPGMKQDCLYDMAAHLLGRCCSGGCA